MVFFILFFAAVIGGFITLVLRVLYRFTALPVWFAPLVAAIVAGSTTFATNVEYGFYVLIGLFILTFVLSLAVFIYSFFSGLKQRFIEERQKSQSTLKTVTKFVASLLVVAIFWGTLTYGPIAFAGLVLLVLIFTWLTPATRVKFFKLQQILPTSRIRSLAMGLVEVEGRVTASEQIVAPLSKKQCIGYRYDKYEVSRDSDGDKHYHLLSTTEKYLPFEITDSSGSVSVIPDGLELVSFSPLVVEDSGYRYTEHTLFNNEKVMLIGNASEQNSRVVIVKDAGKDILALSPVTRVSQWNKSRPLVNRALVFCSVTAFMIAVILTIPYTFDGHILTLNFWQSPFFSWIKP